MYKILIKQIFPTFKQKQILTSVIAVVDLRKTIPTCRIYLVNIDLLKQLPFC